MFNSVHIPLCIQKYFPSLGIFYRECRPDPGLGPYLAYYWMLRFADITYPVKTTPPDTGTDIVIGLDNPLNPFLFGQSTSFFQVPGGRNHNIFGIRLKPGVAYTLLGIPAGEIYDMAVPLSSLIPKQSFSEYRIAIEKDGITAGSSFPAVVRAIGRWLSALAGQIQDCAGKAVDLLRIMTIMDTDPSIDLICGSLSLSARQTERLFNKLFGLTPKSFLRISRFQAALAGKNTNEGIPWSEISQDYGYFDQAHLCRDFREFTGMSPQEYFSHHLH
ncbi:MAG: AraC family transcriptional regulator [Spirochaetales bacterium]|nr:AraC family transcriptional regulator [Spirochaetales bacterium]